VKGGLWGGRADPSDWADARTVGALTGLEALMVLRLVIRTLYATRGLSALDWSPRYRPLEPR
jgi:hypothetical protein